MQFIPQDSTLDSYAYAQIRAQLAFLSTGNCALYIIADNAIVTIIPMGRT